MDMPRVVAVRLAFVAGLFCLSVPLMAAAQPGEPSHGLALRGRWVTVPGWELSPYTDAHTQLDAGYSVGLEYLYLRKGFDVEIETSTVEHRGSVNWRKER